MSGNMERSMGLDLEGSIHVGVFHDGKSFLAVTQDAMNIPFPEITGFVYIIHFAT